MVGYITSPKDGVTRISDDKFIARNVNDPEWIAFLDWQSAGGVINDYVAPADPWKWFIDIGPFFDRFGPAKMAVLMSTHPVVTAVLTDVSVRKWIDLRKQSVADGITALMAVGIPITQELKETILTTPVQPFEQSAARKLYEGVDTES